MNPAVPNIVFIDNSIHKIYKTLDGLKREFKNIRPFANEEEGVDFINSEKVDVVFLNLDLLPNDAVTITKELKQKQLKFNPLVVVYSDKHDDFVQEMVFNAGADSFINFHTKPDILILFIKNLLRRRINISVEVNKQIVIDEEKYLVYKNGIAIQLPKKEFRIFELLYTESGKFFSKEEIAIRIWNDKEVSKKRVIDVHIYNIRLLFGKRVIQTQKGKGYRLQNKFV